MARNTAAQAAAGINITTPMAAANMRTGTPASMAMPAA
jgi:hypothetical protein